MKEIEIGELFREKLSDIQGVPAADGWQKIRRTAAIRKVTRRYRIRRGLWITAAVLAVASVVLLGVLSSKSSEKQSPMVNGKEVPASLIPATPVIEVVEEDVSIPSMRPKLAKPSTSVVVADSVIGDAVIPYSINLKEEKNVPSGNAVGSKTFQESEKTSENQKNTHNSKQIEETSHSTNHNEWKTGEDNVVLRYSGDTSVCRNSMVTLFVENAVDVIWSTGTHASTLNVYPEEPMTLYAQVQRVDKTDTVIYFQIDVFDCNLFIPSAFTPNGDGLNDEFIVYAPMEISHYECTIFDKASRVLFQTKSIQQGWNGTCEGKLLPTGGYFYIIKYRDKLNEQHIEKGQVVLVR
ncbi:MAG: gliding motility-associated C-terminal domain-containing protein [Bacteroidales bacterium]|nr:gliding motility-associated C-terminal domain-containing protein [Bacteroidales bacterium]